MLSLVYYRLYAQGYETPSKVAFDLEEPSLGRVRMDAIAPPHTPSSIKRHISRVEKTLPLLSANLFADISCDTPLTESHVSTLRNDIPGQSPEEPMAIVQVNSALVPEGVYFIKSKEKNLADNYYWSAETDPITQVHCAQLSQPDGRPSTKVNEHAPVC
jgi:hypothetical protein